MTSAAEVLRAAIRTATAADVLNAAVKAAQTVLLHVEDGEQEAAENQVIGLQQLRGLYQRHEAKQVTRLLERLAAELGDSP